MRQAAPAVDLLRSLTEMQMFLNQEVIPAVFPGRSLIGIRQRHVTYRSAAECHVLYGLQFEGSADDAPRFATVTIAERAKLHRVYAEHYGAESETDAPKRAYLTSDGGCLVEFYPATWKLPSLALAADVRRAAAMLRVDELRIELVRHRPHRGAVLRYVIDPSGSGERQELYAKVYPSAGKARQVWRAMTAMSEQASEIGIDAPKPVRLVENWSLVLMEPVRGERLKDALKRSTSAEGVSEQVRMAAMSLSSLRNLRLQTDQVRSLGRLVAHLQKRGARLAELAPEVAERIGPIVDRAEQMAKRSSDPAPVMIHGDFKPSQVFLHEGRVALVDLDRVSLGDPAVDVGSFLAVLHKKSLREGNERYRSLADVFLATCRANSPDDALLVRARIAQCLSLARMAVGKFEAMAFAAPAGPNESRAFEILDEAGACLDEV